MAFNTSGSAREKEGRMDTGDLLESKGENGYLVVVPLDQKMAKSMMMLTEKDSQQREGGEFIVYNDEKGVHS